MAGSNESALFMPGSLRRIWRNAGVPTDGVNGTYAAIAEKGDLLIDSTNATLYQNTNTQASPTWTLKAASGAAIGVVGDMAAAGTSIANSIGVGTTSASIDHVHALGAHDHSGATKGGAVAMGVVGSMAADGTSTANAAGTGTTPAAIDHVHKIGDHDHSGNTKGNAIALAALGADFFTADATGRGKFQTGLLDAATLLDLVAADALTNANCDAFFAANAFAADADSRAIFADGIWTGAKLADDCLSADATGRAKIADDFFNAATVLAKFGTDSIDATAAADIIADNAIPSGKVNWNYGGVGDIVTIVPDASAATGSGAGVARIDHTHAIVCGPPVDGSLAAANAEGAANTFARADHAHKAILVDDAPFNFGTGSDIQVMLSSANLHASSTNEDLVIALSNNNQALHITDVGAKATNWNLADTTHPTVYIHSNTTPATDYLALSHDATDGVIDSVGGNLVLKATSVELASFEPASVVFNEAGADIDYRVETDGAAYAIYTDGGKNSIVLGANADASSADKVVTISRAARANTATTNFADLWIEPAGAVTTTGVTGIVASVYLKEPNITIGSDSVTVAATLYIADAPTEGGANYAFYVAAGAVGLQALAVAGALTVAGAVIVNDASADVDFRVESNGLEYALYIDGAKDCVVIGDNTDVSDIDIRLRVGNVAKTLAANESASILWVAPTGATTTSAGAGVHGVISSAYFAEPNITAATGTITVAATLYIADAPTEGVANAALYVAAGATTLQALTCAALACASATVTGGGAVKSSSATEIGIQVTNGALTVGTSGSLVIPYLSSTGAAFSDAIGGDLNGAVGINYDSDTGPTTTLEARVEASWLSVALAGFEIQGRTVGGSRKRGERWHDNQILGNDLADETICSICGKKMNVGEPIVLYPNYERNSHGDTNLHCVFAHLSCAK